MAKPLYKMTDAELNALSLSDDDRADEAWTELSFRAHEREYNPPEDTPCLDEPWWVTER